MVPIDAVSSASKCVGHRLPLVCQLPEPAAHLIIGAAGSQTASTSHLFSQFLHTFLGQIGVFRHKDQDQSLQL
jgi:hypothetical protein